MPGSFLFIIENCRLSEAGQPAPDDTAEPAPLLLLAKDLLTMFFTEVKAPMLLLASETDPTPLKYPGAIFITTETIQDLQDFLLLLKTGYTVRSIRKSTSKPPAEVFRFSGAASIC
jgi:hypothetical protein